MIFPNLWGLLLLLSIPVLILIYIIKREHRERAVSGTYLWHLSERFLKKRLPIKRLSVFLTFLLQLIILALFAISAMKPAMALGQFSGKIVVIDASASMLTEDDGVSRFDAAVEKAKALAESGLCSSMTVILASNTPSCLVMAGSMSEALDALDNATCGYGGVDLYETMKLVREASARIGLAQVIFYTDTEYADVENVDIVDMRRGETNLAITDLTYAAGEFQGTLISYGEDREVNAALYVEDTLVDILPVSCLDGVPTTVRFETDVTSFETATLRVDVEDSLEIDNSFSVAGPKSEPVSVLVIGEETLFFEQGFKALGNCEVTVKKTYDHKDDGLYDLYIFSGNIPQRDTFPQTGMTIGFLQYDNSAVTNGSPVRTFLGSLTCTNSFYGKTGMELIYDRQLELDPLFDGMETALQDVYVRHFRDFDLRTSHLVNLTNIFDWETICGSPVSNTTSSWLSQFTFACRRILNNDARQYLFTFPISETNLSLTPAFLMLLKNACTLAAPPTLEKSHYAVGELVGMNMKDGAKSPAVTDPDGTVTELRGTSPTFVPTRPGIHTLTYEMDQEAPEISSDTLPGYEYFPSKPNWGQGNQDPVDPGSHTRTAAFFVHIPASEYETFSGESIYYHNAFDLDRDGKLLTNTLLPFTAVILAALLILEWGYYYRGKH